MSERPDTDRLSSAFSQPNTPMMDMRAPAEFSRGAFACSAKPAFDER